MSRYALGRTLQFVGLTILPMAIAAELAEKVTLLQSLGIALGGMALFYVGFLVQPRT